MKMKKIVAAVCATALVAFGAVALTGCGQDDAEVVREGVTAELESVKNLDQEFVDQFLAETDIAELEAYGIDGEEFLRAYLDGFDYTVDDVTVDGDTAVATVSITSKSLNEAMSTISDDLMALADDESIADVAQDEEALNQLIGDTVMESMNSLQTTTKSGIELEYALQDNTWTPTAACEMALNNALME